MRRLLLLGTANEWRRLAEEHCLHESAADLLATAAELELLALCDPLTPALFEMSSPDKKEAQP